MTIDELKSLIDTAANRDTLLNMVNQALDSRNKAIVENEANAATVAKIREDHDAEMKKLKEEHDAALAAKDADRAAIEQDRDAHAVKFANLESVMGLTDGGKALIAQREAAAKAERMAALEAELAVLKG